MRSLDAQIPTKTLPEVVDALAHEITPDLARRGVDYRGRKIKPSHVTAAMVLHFLRMDPAEREKVVREGLRELDRLQDCDEYQRLSPRAETPPTAPEVIGGKPTRARKRNNGAA